VVVRDATEADLPAILAVYNDVIATSTAIWREEPVTLEDRTAWFAAQHAEGFPVLVATVGDDVAGFASFGHFRHHPGYHPTVEHSIHVAAGHRGRGVGTALLDAIVARARALGRSVVVGGIDGANEASIRLHERAGFREVARMPGIGRKHGEVLDLVLLQLDLDPPPA
jgi:phosphinothricin acetyltransferase